MSNYWYSVAGQNVKVRGRTSQRANKPGGESARNGEKEPGGKQARGQTSQGANLQRGEKA